MSPLGSSSSLLPPCFTPVLPSFVALCSISLNTPSSCFRTSRANSIPRSLRPCRSQKSRLCPPLAHAWYVRINTTWSPMRLSCSEHNDSGGAPRRSPSPSPSPSRGGPFPVYTLSTLSIAATVAISSTHPNLRAASIALASCGSTGSGDISRPRSVTAPSSSMAPSAYSCRSASPIASTSGLSRKSKSRTSSPSMRSVLR